MRRITDEGVLAAELEDDGGEVGRGALHDALADGGRADEEDLVDAGLDQGGAGLALAHDEGHQLGVVAAGGQHLAEQLLEVVLGRQRALRHLDHRRVAGEQSRHGRRRHVVERIVLYSTLRQPLPDEHI